MARIRQWIVGARTRAPETSRRAKHLLAPALRLAYGGLDLVSRPHQAPVFVLGHHKTGTTVIANLLAATARLRISSDPWNAREWYPLDDLMHGKLRFDTYVNRTRYHFSAPIIKEPDLTYLYPALRERFPQARYIFVVRNPWEMIRSILDRLEISGKLEYLDTTDQRRLHKLPGWRMIFDPLPLDIPSRQYIDVLAYRWAYAAEVYLAQSNKMELVRYEDFVENKGETIRKLLDALGLPQSGNSEGLYEVAYQPAGKHRNHSSDVFSTDNAARIEQICGALAKRLGYSGLSA